LYDARVPINIIGHCVRSAHDPARREKRGENTHADPIGRYPRVHLRPRTMSAVAVGVAATVEKEYHRYRIAIVINRSGMTRCIDAVLRANEPPERVSFADRLK